MANKRDQKSMEAIIRPEDLEELQDFRGALQERIDKAHEDGRVYLMSQYTVMMATVSCAITKIQARFERDAMASTRKELKALKEEMKKAKGGENEGEEEDEN